MELSEIREQSAKAAEQVCEAAKLKIGEAVLLCARRRPKFVGGSRAVYNEKLL